MKEQKTGAAKASMNILQGMAGIIALAAGVLFIVVGVGLVWFFQADIAGFELVFVLGMASSIAGLFVTFAMDRSAKFSQRCQVKAINVKWLLIAPIAMTFAIGGLIVFLAIADFDFDINMELEVYKNLLLFVVALIIAAIPSFFLYFGLKTLKAKWRKTMDAGRGTTTRGKAVKSTALAAVGVIALVAGIVAIPFFDSLYLTSTIRNGNGHNDGPWITWNADPRTSACISWLTASKNSTVVRYGTNPASLNLTYSDPSEAFLHKAFIQGLSPDTTYFYRVPESFETPHASTLFNFTTAPSTPRPFKFAVFGGMQPDSASSDMMRTNGVIVDGILKRNVDFAVQLGDIASSGSNLADWHLSFTSLARLGANVPLQNAIGNHDWNGVTGSVNWGELFTYPYAGSPFSKYYSYDYLNAHFVVIDNFERMSSMTAAQLKWIEDDVVAARARGQDWIFCFFHLAIMTTATSGMNQGLQQRLVPLFDRLAVDAVFYGHDHDYEHYNYTYGGNGLVYEPGHTWAHNPVQYFKTGSGGANLEVGYGVLNQGLSVDTVRWWNTSAGIYQENQYQRRPWNASRYVSNPGFVVNYTQYDPSGTHDGKYYYHYPPSQAYHDEVTQLGFGYGEQAYHFMEISINGATCNITAMYPNGVTLSGPGSLSPQTWLLVKP